MVPSYKNRTLDEIVSAHIFHDALGFGLRAASWIDYLERTGDFAAAQYACIDARLCIEHLVFELLVITANPRLTENDYQRCLKSPRQLDKLIKQIVPDYERLVAFSEIIQQLTPGVPRINKWDIKGLMKDWGVLSSTLHWSGAPADTTENEAWQASTTESIRMVVIPLWKKLSSGRSGCIQIDSMEPRVREVWEQFRTNAIDADSARIRLELVRP